jgi:hypothetical protein
MNNTDCGVVVRDNASARILANTITGSRGGVRLLFLGITIQFADVRTSRIETN